MTTTNTIYVHTVAACFAAISVFYILARALYNTRSIIHTQWVPLFDTDHNGNKRELFRVAKALQTTVTSRVVFATICRDVSQERLERNIRLVENLGAMFADYRVVMFENDSTLATRTVLKEWTQRNPRCELLECVSEGDRECRLREKTAMATVRGTDHTARVTKLARFRQKVFDHIKEHYSHFEYMFVIDIDLVVRTTARGFLSNFETDNWGSVCAYSISALSSGVPTIYDTFSTWLITDDAPIHMSKRESSGLQGLRIRAKTAYYKFKADTTTSTPTLMDVNACFNGMCVYNLPRVLSSGCRYVDEVYNAMGECEHVTFSRGLVRNHVSNYINMRWEAVVLNDNK